ncbi:MAG: GWxTD domain-containing protein [Candidatus Aminicenantes bacterium]
MNKQKTCLLIFTGICLNIQFLLSSPMKQNSGLPEKFRKWLKEEVTYIITDLEKEVFLQLQTDKERLLFMEAFWKHRDPTPATPENEFKEEHYRRIDYANYHFGRAASKPGWETDRGRIYIILGKPQHVSRYYGESQLYNTEVWFYQGLTKFGLPPGFNLVFYQKNGVGEYVLYSPSRDGPQVFMASFIGDPGDYVAAYKALKEINPNLARVSLSLIPGEPVFSGRPSLSSEIMIQNVQNVPKKQVKDKYAAKFLMYKDTVEIEYTANYIDSDSLIRVIKDKSGLYFVHYVVELRRVSVNSYHDKYYTNLQVNVHVSDEEGKTIYQYQRPVSMELNKSQIEDITYLPFGFYDMFPLIPGKYEVSILVKNEVSKEFTSVERDIVVPEDESLLRISSLILGYMTNPIPAQSHNLRPLGIGSFQMYCEPRKVFLPQDKLFLSFQILGLASHPLKSGILKFEFFREDEPFFTTSRKLSEYQNRLNFMQEFSLQKFPPSHYTARVSLIHNNSLLISKEEEFDVTSLSSIPRPWISKRALPPASDPVYALILGRQLFNKGEIKEARVQLEKAYNSKPHTLDYALNLAQIYFVTKEYGRIKQILLPFSESTQANYDVLFLLGRAYQADEDWSQAVSFYSRAISHFGINAIILNSLGECYYQKGVKDEALAAWKKSLEINPKQPEIKRKVASLKE